MNTWFKYPLIAVTVLLFFCLPASVCGQVPGSSPGGIDVILIVDNSIRSVNYSDEDAIDDPEAKRKQRINLVNSMALSFVPDDLDNRVSIISYASSARLERSVKFTKSLDHLLDLEPDAINVYEPNVVAALSEAEKIENSDRKKVIVFITDSQPSQATEKRLEKRLQDLIKKQKVEVRVIFTGMSDADNSWAQLESKKLIQLNSIRSDQLFDTAEDVLAPLLKFNKVQNPGASYSCPPLLRRLIIKVTAGASQNIGKVAVQDPDRQPLSASALVPAIANGNGLAMFVSNNPLSRDYRITGISEEDTVIQIEEYPPFLNKILPNETVHPLANMQIELELKTGTNQPLKPSRIEGLPVQVNVRMGDPTIHPSPIMMSYSNGKLTGFHTFVAEGQYKIVSLNSVPEAMVDWKVPLDNDDSFIEVNSRPAYTLRLIEPDSTQSIKVTPFTGKVKLRFALEATDDRSGSELVKNIQDPNTWIKLQLCDKDGHRVIDPVDLHESEGIFTAELRIPGLWNPLDAFKARDIYFLIQSRDRLQDNDPFVYSIILPNDPAAKPLIQYSTQPIRLRVGLIWWAVAVAGLILLLLLFLLTILLNEYLFLPRRIKREDEKKNRTVILKIYDQEEDPTGAQPKAIYLMNAIRFKLDKQAMIPAGGSNLSARLFRLRRLYSNGPAEATIKYRWMRGGKTFKTHLRTGKVTKLENDSVEHRSIVATLDEM